jgi:uncharacterized protein
MVVINSLRFDGSVKRTWNCDLLETSDTAMIFAGVFEQDVRHSRLGLIRRGTISREYYWLDRWFNVFEFRELDGSFRNFYCNINMPPTFIDGLLEYVDLDVDVVVWADGRIEVLDIDEFEASAFPPTIKERVENTLEALLAMIHRRDWPFDLLGK